MKKGKLKIGKGILIVFISAGISINIARWLFDLWAKSALIISLIVLVSTLILSTAIFGFIKKHSYSFNNFRKNRFLLITLVSIVFSFSLAFLFPHTFSSSFMVSPKLIEGQEIILFEIKAGNYIVPIQTIAGDYGWKVGDNKIVAKSNSEPLLVQINHRAATPVTFLFQSSPQSGNVEITKGAKRVSANLQNFSDSQTLLTLRTDFRGLPNWIFRLVTISADVVAYGFYFAALFIFQEIGQFAKTPRDREKGGIFHRKGLIILIAISTIFHLISIFSVPLILGADSPSYIRGAFTLAENGNLDGVSSIRGPGTSLLLAPAIILFGRNPWGVKILLHLFALTLIPLSYRIGWQLSGRYRIAFLVGLSVVLLPDLYFFSNYVMSDLLNLVFISAFTTLLISAVKTGKKRWVISALLIASFAVLIRSENLALLVMGAFILAVQPFIEKFLDQRKEGFKRRFWQRILFVAIALIIAYVPIFWWSYRNYTNNGVYGMGNYAGEVIYTGWIYYAEASGYPFTSQDSPSVQSIAEAIKKYSIERMNDSGVPTGWNIYPSLIKAGYSSDQSFELMSNAVKDSILANPRMAIEVLIVKIKDGLTPVTTQMRTFPLPGEEFIQDPLKSKFFNSETLRINIFIRVQRAIYQLLRYFYENIYPWLVWVGFIATIFCIFRKPELIWWSIIAIALTRIFIPDVLGKSDWRYTLSGIPLIQTMTILWITTTCKGIKRFFSKSKIKKI